jgi:hypothetical protein
MEKEGGKQTHPPVDRVLTLELGKELLRLAVVLPKLLDHISTHVRVVLLDLLGDAEAVLGGDVLLVAVAEELLNEGGDVASGDGDVTDGGTDDVTFSL